MTPTVKVRVKREQVEKALNERFPIRRFSTRGVGLFSSVTQAEYKCPEEFTLELPVEQITWPFPKASGVTPEQVGAKPKRTKKYKIVKPEGGLVNGVSVCGESPTWISKFETIELEEIDE